MIDCVKNVRYCFQPGLNPVPLYLAYKEDGLITPDESRDLTTEMIAALFKRLVKLETA